MEFRDFKKILTQQIMDLKPAPEVPADTSPFRYYLRKSQQKRRVQLILSKLVDAELTAGEAAIAEKIAEKSKSMVDLFDMWKYGGYTASYQIAFQEKQFHRFAP